MRLQFHVTDHDIYYSTFIDFDQVSDSWESCRCNDTHSETKYFNNEVMNELWVDGDNVETVWWYGVSKTTVQRVRVICIVRRIARTAMATPL